MLNYKKVQNCAEAISRAVKPGFTPALALVLGTGLGGMADALDDKIFIPYSTLPDYPPSTAPTHKGGFACGFLQKTPVIIQQGRCHLYEGYSPEDVCLGVRAMARCGAKTLLVTNSAGAVNPLFQTGNLMLISDHINLTWQSPLTGVNDEAWGPRFPDMSQAYDPELMRVMEEEAMKLGLRLEKGVYASVGGPQFETPAETRFYRAVGADAIGMSTVLEVIAARHMGLRVAGLSCLSNKNLPDCMAPNSLEEVVAVAEQAAAGLRKLLPAFVRRLGAMGQ